MEDSIRAYFRSWIEKDEAAFQRSFSQDAVYSECYGPEYHGLPQLLRWFRDWNARGSVLSWEITVTVQMA